MMNEAQRLAAIEKLLVEQGVNPADAQEAARHATTSVEPVLESLCFRRLAEHLLAAIHSTSWISHRAKNPSTDPEGIFNRLLASGASPNDLAQFARIMQREYLSNLACLLDGAGIFGTPDLPCQEFRVFAVDDEDTPLAKLDDLHEGLGWTDLKTEMKLSREAARSSA